MIDLSDYNEDLKESQALMREHGFEYREKVYWLADNGEWRIGVLSFTVDGEPVVKYFGGRSAWLEAITSWSRIKKFSDKSHLKRKPKVN